MLVTLEQYSSATTQKTGVSIGTMTAAELEKAGAEARRKKTMRRPSNIFRQR